MVYLHGMSHQFEINVINAFHDKFCNDIGKFLKSSCFFVFGIQKKRRLYVFNFISFARICYLLCLLLFRFIAVSVIMVHGYYSWNIFDDLFKYLQFLKGCFHAFMQFPSHTQEHVEKKNTHTTMFFFEKSWAKFFLKPFVFVIQFQDKSRILFL